MNEDCKVNFDMSLLTYEQLIEVYSEINNFINTLSNKKIEQRGE